ncbi:SAM-dependent methyltransferase, type 11 [Syntrophotalea carbinolica DSM 2380]|uniref:SAM-dependent methyltransferase, type 11 n=1 Tax=Syntrophotalea carbinolica (strain DSM 2380 / NBRC 103641 / GraBd1) TaxID=338963 RepID=Q3A808_SYNC1|nr:methyltransferase domain-containing protein [Syntrophotalea carbinolica]ABA87484.1 SAM-dependent methyltransferase, type 11 [Syntrophotalea carbinolica DSM 2380]
MPYVCPLNKPNLYESLALRKATGPAIRPGGLSVLEEVLERYPFNEGARVLDVGCGMGTSVAWLRSRCGLRASGMDLSRALLSEGAQQESRLPLVQARAERLPVADNCCHGVICECVLSLVSDAKRVLSEFYRVLTPGGLLIMSDIYRRNPLDSDQSLPCASCFSGASGREGVLRWLTDTGFTLHLWEDHSHLLRELAAKLIFMHGSMSAFWEQFAGETDGSKMEQAVQAMRPGYYLIVAGKA